MEASVILFAIAGLVLLGVLGYTFRQFVGWTPPPLDSGESVVLKARAAAASPDERRKAFGRLFLTSRRLVWVPVVAWVTHASSHSFLLSEITRCEPSTDALLHKVSRPLLVETARESVLYFFDGLRVGSAKEDASRWAYAIAEQRGTPASEGLLKEPRRPVEGGELVRLGNLWRWTAGAALLLLAVLVAAIFDPNPLLLLGLALALAIACTQGLILLRRLRRSQSGHDH